MKLVLCTALFLSLAARTGWAQQATAPAADTAGYEAFTYAKGADRYYLGILPKADGTQVPAYPPTRHVGYKGRITYFLPSLSVTDARRRRSINVKKIKRMEVRGRSCESIALNGKPIDVLAVQLLDGLVTLATIALAQAIPIPIPLGIGLPLLVVGIPCQITTAGTYAVTASGRKFATLILLPL